jgi:hypothetical protein
MPWEELPSARVTGARQSCLFIGRVRGRLSPRILGNWKARDSSVRSRHRIRRFTQRLKIDRTHLEKASLVPKNGASLTTLVYCGGSRVHHFRFRIEKVGPRRAGMLSSVSRWAEY